jgi:hypothetical protein
MAKRGTPLERLPVVDYQILDLCRLFREVNKRGGMVSVSEEKRWAEVARALGLQASSGSVIRQHYQKILHPYELHKKRESDDPSSKATVGASSTSGANCGESTGIGANNGNDEDPSSAPVVKEDPDGPPSSNGPGPESDKPAIKLEPAAAAAVAKVENGAGSAEIGAQGARPAAGTAPSAGPEAYRLVRAPDGACRVMAAGEAGAGGAGAGDGGDDDDEEFVWTGYHDGRRYTLAEYEEMADKFRAERFPDTSISEAEVRPSGPWAGTDRPVAGVDRRPLAGADRDCFAD